MKEEKEEEEEKEVELFFEEKLNDHKKKITDAELWASTPH
jgi:hypothetical protein